MVTPARGRSPDLDLDSGPAVEPATATASNTAPAVFSVSGDDDIDGNNSNSNSNGDGSNKADDGITNFRPSPRFWVILVTCAVMALLSALENTVVTTALPHIVADLDMGENYVWITNVFFLTGYVTWQAVACQSPVPPTRGLPDL